MFTLTIKTENDSFGESQTEKANEINRLIDVIMRQLNRGNTTAKIYDTNGNCVGRWEWTEKSDFFDDGA
jgi:hypothetical protein